MQTKYPATVILILTVFIFSCGKVYHPPTATSPASSSTVNKTSTTTVKKPGVKKVPYVAPKVIAVNDSVAKKSVDGRLYYDLLGYRYWRNYNDGKYYLFNKSMFTDSAFKPH
jgi:hypothetical protein